MKTNTTKHCVLAMDSKKPFSWHWVKLSSLLTVKFNFVLKSSSSSSASCLFDGRTDNLLSAVK